MNRDEQGALVRGFQRREPTTRMRSSRGPSRARRSGRTRAATGGFTLIEVMITCAIIAILAAIAYPSYANFVLRGKLVEPTNYLTAQRAVLEQFYQDNRTYAPVGTSTPCDPTPLFLKDFKVACTLAPGNNGYTIEATGSKPATTGFKYSITNTNIQTSTVGAVWSNATCPTTWIVKNGDPC